MYDLLVSTTILSSLRRVEIHADQIEERTKDNSTLWVLTKTKQFILHLCLRNTNLLHVFTFFICTCPLAFVSIQFNFPKHEKIYSLIIRYYVIKGLSNIFHQWYSFQLAAIAIASKKNTCLLCMLTWK